MYTAILTRESNTAFLFAENRSMRLLLALYVCCYLWTPANLSWAPFSKNNEKGEYTTEKRPDSDYTS